MKKRILLISLSTILAFSFVSCGSKNKDDTLQAYDINTSEDGVYILKKDGTAYKALNEGRVSSDTGTLHYWLTKDYDDKIPEVGKGDKIIVKNISSRPEEINFTKLTDYGYTVGLNFEVIDNEETQKQIITFGDDINELSPVGPYLNANVSTSGENVQIREINGKDFKASMLTSDGYLKGLTQDAMYKFVYYEGTYYKSIVIQADSHLFLEEEVFPSNAYIEEKTNYFTIVLPDNLTNGYYDLGGDIGIIKYTGASESIENNQNNTDEENTTQEETQNNTQETSQSNENPDITEENPNLATDTPDDNTMDNTSIDTTNNVSENTNNENSISNDLQTDENTNNMAP